MAGESYNKGLCEERHKSIDDKLNEHEERLDKHDIDISSLKIDNGKNQTNIENLCGKIGDLVTIVKWFIGIMIGSFVGFFFYAVQQHLFK